MQVFLASGVSSCLRKCRANRCIWVGCLMVWVALPHANALAQQANTQGTTQVPTLGTSAQANKAVPLPGKPKPLTIPYKQGWTLLKHSFRLSRDQKRHAYLLQRDRQNRIMAVIDGKEGRIGSQVLGPVFSPDSKEAVYFFSSSQGWLMYRNGRYTPMLEPIGKPKFSSDSKHLFYWSRLGSKACLIYDGVKHARYRKVRFNTLTVSPDSKHIAYVAYRDRQWLLVVDHKEYNLSNPNVRIRFTPDSATVKLVGGTVKQ